MSSSVDATKPADAVPAVKSDLRSNLSIIKTEINHGGFAQGLTPTEYSPATSKVKDHLSAINTALAALSSSLSGGGDVTISSNELSDLMNAILYSYSSRLHYRAGSQTTSDFAAGSVIVNGGQGPVSYTIASRLTSSQTGIARQLLVINKGSGGVGGAITWVAGAGITLRGDTEPLSFGHDAVITFFREHDGSAEFASIRRTG